MTIQEFVEAVQRDALKDKEVENVWKKMCYILAQLTADEIRDMVMNDALDGFVEIESMDGFGTEGMNL